MYIEVSRGPKAGHGVGAPRGRAPPGHWRQLGAECSCRCLGGSLAARRPGHDPRPSSVVPLPVQAAALSPHALLVVLADHRDPSSAPSESEHLARALLPVRGLLGGGQDWAG